MLKSREIKVIHLEPTDVCQASCPLCARETDLNFNKSKKHHLTIDQILHHIDRKGIQNLDKMFMCGNYGDPAAGRYTLDIYRYFRRINPEITLGMNSNGAIQNAAWWQTLGEIFHRQQDYVVFSIDGLRDTNHIYRQGVDWNKLIENARSYISTGAIAHWDMLIYRHNEHQVRDCQELARDLGFTWFRAKISKRPVLAGLEFPLGWKSLESTPVDINIKCQSLEEQSMFIDAKGRASPCCWLGSTQLPLLENWDDISDSWNSRSPNLTCVKTCNQSKGSTPFLKQWRIEMEL